jgi:hypothetical protein
MQSPACCGVLSALISMLIATTISVSAPPVIPDEQISASELVSKWSDTTLKSARIEFEESLRTRLPMAGDPFDKGAAPILPEWNKSGELLFSKDFGMKLTYAGERKDISNLFEGRGLHITNLNLFDMVTIEKPIDSHLKNLSLTISLVAWLDPLNSKWSGAIKKRGEEKLSTTITPGGKRFVQLQLENELLTFAEEWDWRVVSVVTSFRAIKQSERTFNYSRSPKGILELLSIVKTTFSEGGKVAQSSHKIAVKSVHVAPPVKAEFVVDIPVPSMVIDSAKDPPEMYILRKDGSKRPFDEAERRRAKSFEDLHDTEPGQIPARKK